MSLAVWWQRFEIWSRPHDPIALAIIIVFGLILLLSFAAYGALRWVREYRDKKTLAQNRRLKLHIPVSLNPYIDPELCIGSLACVSVCPEGTVLGLVDGKGAVIASSKCIGHGKCAEACPVQAIKLVFGTSERGVDLPQLDSDFETSRPGVHIVGELGGMGLIRNAVSQGVQVGTELARRLEGRRSSVPDQVDVAIVGAGPAGLATAVTCKAFDLSYAVLEQDTLGGTIAHYPRQKVVMSEPVDLPLYGRIGKSRIGKEELVDLWTKIVRKTALRVDQGVRVTGVQGDDGDFTVDTTAGSVRASKVVLALGRRGTPRKLGAPGEDLAKVTYRLIEPDQYHGKRVLVVGGGDSAFEAAAMLAGETDAEVSLSYLGPVFTRGRADNRAQIERLMRSGRVRPLMSTKVQRIEPEHVFLTAEDGDLRIDNDFVIICIGGTLPTELLKAVNVDLVRHFGHDRVERRAQDQGEGFSDAPVRLPPEPVSVARRGGHALAVFLTGLGVAIIGALGWYGYDYYTLSAAARAESPRHALLRPSGLYGHGIGVLATGVMLLNFLYTVRKHWRTFQGVGSLRHWLTLHVWVGVVCPTLIAFHATFQSNNLLATVTAAVLGIVVATGLVGRWFFALLPTRGGEVLSAAEVQVEWEKLMRALNAAKARSSDLHSIEQGTRSMFVLPQPGASLFAVLRHMARDAMIARRHVAGLRRYFPDGRDFTRFRETYLRLRKTQLQISFYDRLRRLMSLWRVLHVVLSIFMVFVIAAHVGISWFLGYRWLLE